MRELQPETDGYHTRTTCNHPKRHHAATTTTPAQVMSSKGLPSWLGPDTEIDSLPANQFIIICGRGKEALDNPGNQRYLGIVREYREQYRSKYSTKEEKKGIIREILSTVRAQGGSFVKIHRDSFVAVTDERCLHDKISHALRRSNPKVTNSRRQRRAFGSRVEHSDKPDQKNSVLQRLTE